MEDLVSVIMPTYNEGALLEESIKSILNQTYRNLELLITDDCSTDEKTLSILKKYKELDERVHVFFLKENCGSGYSRNVSIENAKGRYIAFCDGDDRWVPTKLERQIAFMREKNYPVTYSSYIICNNKGKEKGIVVAPKKITYSMLKHDNKIGCLTAVYDTKLLGKKYFMPLIRKRQDWALFLTMLKDCKVAYGIKSPLAYYRVRAGSLSKNKFSLIKYNASVYQKILGYSPVKSYFYLTFVFLPSYFTKVLKKKIDSSLYTSHLLIL